MSDPGSGTFRRNLERKLDFTDVHSTHVPSPTENEIFRHLDEADIVLDLDGWQKIIQVEEDLNFLRQSLEDVTAAPLSHKNLEEWAQAQINLKAYYHGQYGVIFKSSQPKSRVITCPTALEAHRLRVYLRYPFRKSANTFHSMQRRRDLDKTQKITLQLQLQNLS